MENTILKDALIYGAGVEGVKLYRELKKQGVNISNFIITDGFEKTTDSIDGIQVKYISEILDRKDDVNVIIGVSDRFSFDISLNLADNGFKNIYSFSKENGENITIHRECKFEDRRKNTKKMCMILAGYKEFLWDNIFERINKYATDDIDICILSSGLYSEKLSEIAKENDWSYLSTSMNCVTNIQNMAIALFKNAEYIYKIDEDIFITKNYFSSMLSTYEKVTSDSMYNISFVAPLIPINGYTHVRVLEKLNLLETYKNKFGEIKCNANDDYSIVKNPEAAKFFWGEGGYVPKIDTISEEFYNSKFAYSVCPIRFSIGSILFKREFWEKIGHFTMNFGGACMGEDEYNLCCGGIWNSYAIIIDENILVGHLSFGQQNKEMKEYYLANKEKFYL